MPLLWLLDSVPLVYEAALSNEPPAGAVGFLNVAVLLPMDSLLSLLVAVLREAVLLPTVPRLVLELMPDPRLTAVRPLSANTLESPSVSYLGTYERFVEMCPP